MTRLDALKELAAKVEAGTLPEAVFHGHFSIRGHWAYITGLTSSQRTNVFLAYSGSLDAAKALHEAVLTGWGWHCGAYGARVWEYPGTAVPQRKRQDVEMHDNPARAWLLAILRALISQEEGA